MIPPVNCLGNSSQSCWVEKPIYQQLLTVRDAYLLFPVSSHLKETVENRAAYWAAHLPFDQISAVLFAVSFYIKGAEA